MGTPRPELVMIDADRDRRVRAAIDGDRGAAESLLLELLPRVRNLVRYLVRGDADADDIAQEALVAVVRGLDSYRGDGKLSSWVDRVVVRVTFAELRRTRRDRGMRRDVPDLAVVADPGAPRDRYGARRDAVKLLDRLPNDQRHVLVMHHVLGMTVAEVSDELDVPHETVRSRLRLAKNKLRALSAGRSAAGGELA